MAPWQQGVVIIAHVISVGTWTNRQLIRHMEKRKAFLGQARHAFCTCLASKKG